MSFSIHPKACAVLGGGSMGAWVFQVTLMKSILCDAVSFSHRNCPPILLQCPCNKRTWQAPSLCHLPPSGMPLLRVWISFISVCRAQHGIAYQLLDRMCKRRFQDGPNTSTGHSCGAGVSIRSCGIVLLLFQVVHSNVQMLSASSGT